MDNLRREELTALWDQEGEYADCQEWREELAPEERDYVAGLDNNYNRGMLRLCSAILIRDKVRQLYSPRMIEELETLQDGCRLRLRDGQTYLVTLTKEMDLRFQTVDTVC